MGLIRKLLDRIRGVDEPLQDYELTEWSEIVYDRDDIKIHDPEERREYIKNCLEQIVEATKEIENLQFEYNMVTSYLKDMEEIEALPEEERLELEEAATRIHQLENQQSNYLKRSNRLSEAQYHKIEALVEEVQEGYVKLKEAEDYQTKIKTDMKHLGNEKDAYIFRKNELQRTLEDMKGMLIICTTAFVLCLILMAVLRFGFGMNTRMGFMLTFIVAAVAISGILFKHMSSVKELKTVEKSINKIILLHNTVKIRYVNNTNLLDYLRLKYEVSDAKELNKMWVSFQEEKAERETYRQAERELDICQKELLHILRRYQIKDPAIWLHQTAAILDRKEMVEIRHNLIIRRQSLRRRMDYNKEVVALRAQDEVKDMVDQYPKYAGEILKMVGAYEKKFNG